MHVGYSPVFENVKFSATHFVSVDDHVADKDIVADLARDLAGDSNCEDPMSSDFPTCSDTRAIRALREYKQIKRLVYISCKPQGAAMGNFVELCNSRPSAQKVGPPFRLQLACPVDMFPQTRHCELLLLFGRC
ncbi:hypothetical protein HPB50_026456 [Hyalomma asiaticum]|uniref:Uncharacterized protein n=1 Tax=Hyalomma asiaticum TaxID=266040 RepID=A0ACB7T070_HYAAI|nr:hypothetical protein HPB50_026456 [Hyalomma asiaticum]